MATIRKLRDKWPAMVRRKGIAPRSKSFDKKTDAEKWARDLEAPAHSRHTGLSPISALRRWPCRKLSLYQHVKPSAGLPGW